MKLFSSPENRPGTTPHKSTEKHRPDFLLVRWPDDPDPFAIVSDKRNLVNVPPEMPAYFPQELREILRLGATPSGVRAIHAVKKTWPRAWIEI